MITSSKRRTGPIDSFTGKPAQGLGLFYFTMRLPERIAYLERWLAEGHEAKIKETCIQLRTMKPGDPCYDGYLAYVTYVPPALRRRKRELKALRLRLAREQAEHGEGG